MPSKRVTLLSAAGNGDGSDANLSSERAQVSCYGTHGSGTTVLQYSPDDGTTYLTVDDVGGNAVSFTADGTAIIEVPAGVYRGSVSGGTGNSVTLQIDTIE